MKQVYNAIQLVKSRNGRVMEDDWDLLEAAELLVEKYINLQNAAMLTLIENRHLADGDDCTLLKLKLALEDANITL